MFRLTACLAIVTVLIVAISIDQDADAQNATEKAVPPASVSSAAPTDQLFEELRAMDAKLFDSSFKNCDPSVVQAIVTDDFEFYHDRGGLIATNGAQFVQRVRESCDRQKAGHEPRSRRELVAGTLEVHPLKNYGAIQIGVHRFFILKDGQPDQLGDIARFTHVWKKEGASWKLARVLSYDHKAAP